MRWSTTANLRASATFARLTPRCLAMQRPGLQAREPCYPGEYDIGRFIQGGTYHRVADFSDPARPVDLTGLVLAGGETKIRPDIPGLAKPRRIVDCRAVAHRNHWADTGRCHELPTDRVSAHDAQQHPVQLGIF